MPLLIRESNVVTITVRYIETEKGMEFFEEPHEGAIEEKFIFKKPSWKLISNMMIDSLMLSPQGVLAMNPFIFMDKKMKGLLSDWTLKDADGKKVPATPENIDKMSPELWEYLNGKLDEFASDKQFGALNNQALAAAKEADKAS